MPINKSTEYGNISISLDATQVQLVERSQNAMVLSEWHHRKQFVMVGPNYLKKENYAKGVVVRQDAEGLVLDLYIIALHGIKLHEVVYEAQKRVKYVLEKTLEVKCSQVNIFVQA